MIFESHAHYDDEKFDIDRDDLLERLPNEGVEYIINVAANIDSAYKCVEIAKKYDYIYAAVGVHPDDVENMKKEDLKIIKELSAYDKVVAIGEIGLDYYYENSSKELQKLWFSEQIETAKELKLPIIVHSRDAAKDTMDIIKSTDAKQIGGVIHCYSGSNELAQEYAKMGFYIGVGGVVTFKNANKLKEVVKKISIDNILIETDSPYLAPVPNRGKRNDSSNLKYVIEQIAEIKDMSYEEVLKSTYENAKKLFRIK
ncbi:TatD family hydrolase [Vallitalea sp.]|jgi:TatD DNase family protein|uniref:TatD family hydrolase n=1 Tax=Vallitalea sp. TaxID=1882829 RepID=UPI0025EA4D2C|nr:TatD family hydrolase [Vallitalea sp.]MCT4685737.1 TatD family hydrolase [Vallitalea sp.]